MLSWWPNDGYLNSLMNIRITQNMEIKYNSWTNFKFMWPCIVTNFFVIQPTRCKNFANLFCHKTLHFSNISSVHHQEFIHRTLSNGVCQTAFEQDQNGIAFTSWSRSKAVYKSVWYIPLLSVQWKNSWWWTEELSETCRVSWQNKFVKLVHLGGLITKKQLGD